MKTKNAVILLLTAAIWGTGFVAQSLGMADMGPIAFNGIRNFIGGITLLPFIFFKEKHRREDEDIKNGGKALVLGGVCCGVFLFAASTLQQIGMQYTAAGKAGFITAFYIVLVPVFCIFLGKKTCLRVWAAVIIALAGLYLLCMTESFHIGKGDAYIFLCAFLFAGHILSIDHFAPRVDVVKMSCIQFFVVGVLAMPLIILFEPTNVWQIRAGIFPLLYAGALSCGVAYTLQIVGQKNMDPTIASLILSLESCISVLAGWIVLGEKLTARELCGCALMFLAIILAQLPKKSKV